MRSWRLVMVVIITALKTEFFTFFIHVNTWIYFSFSILISYIFGEIILRFLLILVTWHRWGWCWARGRSCSIYIGISLFICIPYGRGLFYCGQRGNFCMFPISPSVSLLCFITIITISFFCRIYYFLFDFVYSFLVSLVLSLNLGWDCYGWLRRLFIYR